MAETKLPKPTEAELDILKVLWQRGPSTVRDVHDELNRTKETGYTTVLKFLQIMTEKGLVERNESERAHIYLARVPQSTTQRQMVGDLLNRVFDGSARNLVLHALSTQKTSADELTAIRNMLDEIEQRQGESPEC